MYCKYCGNYIEGNEKYCNKCGKENKKLKIDNKFKEEVECKEGNFYVYIAIVLMIVPLVINYKYFLNINEYIFYNII